MTSLGRDSSQELESNISQLALALFAPATVAGTLQRIVDLAVVTIDGCDASGIVFAGAAGVSTPAYSDLTAVELHGIQFRAGEGPCLDATSEGGGCYAADLTDDPRWPTFGPAATAAGIRSLLAYRLGPCRSSALSLYAQRPGAFSPTDRAKGLIFATLAGLALDSAVGREDSEKNAANLHEALRTRELIGQAQGILMERERVTADQAFDMLRRASQHLNIKLREVAQTLVDTGQQPQPGQL